ncbi:hypothetical protein MSA03_23100 [Microbacterium saccharophilum]|nr:hypothetical protein [Microbacterium saccharophilum]GEP48802.1 hypothetical protein MSA03_23100 [Microbacterium saccharophilum]
MTLIQINTPKINPQERSWRDCTSEIAAALRDLSSMLARLTESAKNGEQP